ncbi:MAG: EamA family transporter [Chloroflexi bacterium]|nr:EamA family transporter [Chloroflexota bacterium]
MSLLVIILALVSAITHASWNMLVRHQRGTDTFTKMSLVIAGIGMPLALIGEFFEQPVLSLTWVWFGLGGIGLALYYYGLTRGYQSGDFSTVYPLVRSLPVLLVAITDVVRGNPPSFVGWIGLILVSIGCTIIPLESFRDWSLARYWNRSTPWVILAAFGVFVYSAFDSIAAQAMQGGISTALRYNVYECSFGLIVFALILKQQRLPILTQGGWSEWRLAIIAAIFMFGSYSLILWAYQLTPHASYIVALRQLGIVLGVAAGTLLFHEPAPKLRITASIIIASGIFLIAQGA